MLISIYFSNLISRLQLFRFQNEWRKENRVNHTVPVNVFDKHLVSVGVGTYGQLCVKDFGCKSSSIKIGNYCSIAENNIFLLSGEHDFSKVTSYPYHKYVLGSKVDSFSKGNIVIEDDVWIGERCIILSGVKIGQGAVVGAGSVVCKDIPPYAIFAGNRIVRYRYDESSVNKMIKFDFSNLQKSDFEEIDKCADISDFFNSEVYKRNIKKI